MSILGFLSKQYNFGARLGGFRILVANIMFYVSMINFLLISVTAYSTTLRDPIRLHLPWFNFPVFVCIMLFLFLIGAIIEHKFVVPAITSYTNSQWYKHKNPAREDLEKILNKLDASEKTQKRVMNKLKRLERRL